MSTIFSVTRVSPTEFYLRGELDMGTAPTFKDEVIEWMAGAGPITLNLSELTFLDSSGMHAFHEAANRLETGCVQLVQPQEAVKRVIEIAGLAEVTGIELVELPDRATV
jgi:anti-anti-sigma factor